VRPARIGLIAGGILLAVAGVGLAARLKRDRVPGHAYAIPSAQDRIVIEVLNGTTRQGLARTVTRLIRRQGIDVVYFGSTDSADRTDSTRIIARRGDPAPAEIVARALGMGKVEIETDTLRRVDVSVILGLDYRPPEEIHP
jgi:LytR cell envelope-related transcriptional attenuator